MTNTRKFSQFISEAVTSVVGLTSGANAIGPNGGGGSGGSSQTFPQQSPLVVAGTWVKVTPTSGMYAAAQGDNSADGEEVGLVTAATATTFTVQQTGYVTTAMAVPGISGLTPGGVYFLSTASSGAMVPTDATVNNQVSRPVFLADSATSGWILPYRPMLVGGASSNSGGGSSTDSNINNVTQTGHGFIAGDVLRVSTLSASGPVLYAKALSDTLAHSQVSGIVCANPAPTVNTFSIQFAGYNVGSLTTDYLGNPIIASTIYYLSNTNAGKVTSVDPGLSGAFSRPVYQAEQGIANAAINAGYILPQRPLEISTAESAYFLLQTFTLTSNQTFLDTTGTFLNGTYKDIRIVGRDIFVNNLGSTNAATIGFQYYANGTLITSNYYTAATNIGNYITLNGSIGSTGTVVTAAGNGMNFEINSKSVNTTDNYKTFSGSTEFYDPSITANASFIQFAAPTGLIVNNTTPTFSTARLASNSTNTNAITGFYFYFPLGSQFFVSGQISIYGILA